MSTQQVYRGPKTLTLLCLCFLTLKLAGLITWSWWWVLSPIWIPWTLYGLFWAAAKLLKLDHKDQVTSPKKSKWQESIEEMQKRQAELKEQQEALRKRQEQEYEEWLKNNPGK